MGTDSAIDLLDSDLQPWTKGYYPIKPQNGITQTTHRVAQARMAVEINAPKNKPNKYCCA
jgi:hypothetical protein